MTTETLTGYQAAIRERARLTQELAQVRKDHAARVAELEAALAEEERLVALAEAGISIEQFQLARQFVDIDWHGYGWDEQNRRRTTERRMSREVADRFAAAREEFRSGVVFLLTHYYGVKEYASWSSQGEDHEYRYGPKHGHIWFKIGMPETMRTAIAAGRVMTDAETIAVVAWLTHVEHDPRLLDAGADR